MLLVLLVEELNGSPEVTSLVNDGANQGVPEVTNLNHIIDLHSVIAVLLCCRKGTHRSVAVSELVELLFDKYIYNDVDAIEARVHQ